MNTVDIDLVKSVGDAFVRTIQYGPDETRRDATSSFFSLL